MAEGHRMGRPNNGKTMSSKVIRIPGDLVEEVEDLILENEIRRDRPRYMKTNAKDWYLTKKYRPKRT